jgi:alkanesulfonate monooxygenase SsuD/methylene tetrahydromethanopterin reductase-like flavin-dependent oxidoreductase (luciferase family)
VTTTLLRFNMATATERPAEHTRLHQDMLAMCEAADAAGVDEVTISEHHVTRNRSCTSPVLLAAAALARTKRVRVSVSALLLPLHDPARVAEDLATLETAFPGRLRVVAAIGYRPEEYELFGRSFSARGKLMDAALSVVLQAWSDPAPDPLVRPPRPVSAPADFLAVGGQSGLAAARAARHRLPFAPRAHLPQLRNLYEQLCAGEGIEPRCWMPAADFAQVHLSEDPDATWATVGRWYLADVAEYVRWQSEGPQSPVFSTASDADELRRSGVVEVLTPEACLARAGADTTLCLHPLAGGMPRGEAWRSFDLFIEHVVPRLGTPGANP